MSNYKKEIIIKNGINQLSLKENFLQQTGERTMKKRLFMVLGLVLLMAGGFAAAAMVSVSAERNVTVSITGDDIGAIKIAPNKNGKYNDIVQDQDKDVKFNLNKAVDEKAGGLNSNAVFTIGSKNEEVFTITNNMPEAIEISFSEEEPVKLFKKGEESNKVSNKNKVKIEKGSTEGFYFVIDTKGKNIEKKQFTGKLLIKSAE